MAYDPPTPDDLRAYYPAFAAVSDATIALYIDQVNGTDVDESWLEADFAPAIMSAAAHRMVRNGVAIAGGDLAGMAGAGLTDFQSGSMRVRFSDEAVKAQIKGGWSTTQYGQNYAEMLRRNKGGPRVIGGGSVPCDYSRDIRDGTYFFR